MAKKSKVTKKVKQTEEVKLKTASQSDKHYIWENSSIKSVNELSQDTGLTVGQVNDILKSTEVDHEPIVDPSEKKAKTIRRFLTKDGSVAMTPAQANLDNLVFEENLAKQNDNFTKRYGQCIERRPIG